MWVEGHADRVTCELVGKWRNGARLQKMTALLAENARRGASPSTDKPESLSHDAATTCTFVMMRPIANTRLLLSQRISGCNRAPLWHFLTPGRRNNAIGMHGNQRQSSQRTSDAQMPLRRGHVCQISKMRLARTMHARQSKCGRGTAMYARRPKTSEPRRRREEVSASQMRHQVTVGNTPLHSHV